MSFLAPLFLLGAAAVAAPIVFHLIRRTTRERTRFSSLMFLTPTLPRLTRRSRLDNLLLLLLRCAVLCLLAAAFARPFFKTLTPETQAAAEVKRTVVLLDTSASMRRAGLWAEATKRVADLVREARPADQVALFTFDRGLHRVMGFEEWLAAPTGDRVAVVTSKLDEIHPGWADTSLDQAVIQAAELLDVEAEDSPDSIRRIVVITDLQEGAQTADLQTHEWPGDMHVITEVVEPQSAGNAGIQWLAGATIETPTQDAPGVRLRVSNASDSTVEQFRVGWAGESFDDQAVEVYVPAGQSRVVSLETAEAAAPTNRVVLVGDKQEFDDEVFVIPPARTDVTVAYLGSDSEMDASQPLYFLRRAFPETRRLKVNVVAARSSEGLPADTLAEAALIVVTDKVGGNLGNRLAEALAEGQTILFAPRSPEAAASLTELAGLEPIRVEEVKPDDYAMLAEIDFGHPLFAPFADARFSDFTKIHFWQYRRFDESKLKGLRVLARFEGGDPAILEGPVGKGRIVVLTSGWHPADSQLALSSKFVPLMFSLLDLSGAAALPPEQYFVGDRVPVGVGAVGEVVVRHPDGTTEVLERGTTEFVPRVPGIYTVGSTGVPVTVAVNLVGSESRTAPLPADELEDLGVPGPRASSDPARVEQRQVQLRNAELEARQKLWRWILVSTLAVVLLETFVAGWTARREANTKEVPA